MGGGKKAASMLARARPRRLSTTAADAWRALAAKEAARSGRTVESLASETPGPAHRALLPRPEVEPAAARRLPFTRGAYATMYSAKPWTIRQYAGFSSAEESNAFYRGACRQQGLSVAFDLPTHRGYDSDHERAAGDVGLAGVPVDSVEDVKILRRRRRPRQDVRVDADERRRAADAGHAPPLRAIQDIFGFTAGRMPRFNSISVSGYHMQEAGADAALELAFTIADGLEYLNCAVEAGIDVDKTSGYSLTAQEPLNNVARTALEALAAVHGGAQSLHTNAFDEAIALPTEHSARVARATQLMIQEETGVTRVADPWGGSYFMEALTSQLADKAREIIADVDAAGGMRAMVESGEAKRRVEDSAAKKQARVDAGVDVVVGVNKHVSGEPGEAVDVLRIDDQKARAPGRAHRGDEGRLGRARRVRGLAVGSYVGEARRFGSEAGEAFSAAARRVEAFEALDGRRPRILVAKVGMDGHDRGANVVAAGFADLGFDVDAGPLFNLPEEVANQAVDADVHAVGVSTMAAGHNTLVPRIVEALRAKGAGHVVVVVGGVVPDCDHDHLKRHGAAVLKRRAPRAESA
ncbi:methylmalonyl-CoA mutase [Aureococcus anophagefferens]|nr:methylmalonyl-CoA mutase [Aureococcus anophagefferens]